MKMKKQINRFFEGVLMGIANIIPGVSGGTIALILGIYERLIHAINSLPLRAPISLLKGDMNKFRKEMKSIDYAFLIPLILGILAATLILARFIEFFLEDFTAPTFAFFFGLILASGGSLYIRLKRFTPKIILSAAAGFFFAFFTVGMSALKTNHSLPIIFFSGALAIISMILPGISGSFILVYLHQYRFMLDALNSFDLPVIGAFLIGAVIGLFSFAKGLEYLLKEHKSVTLAFLFGLILGALRVPVARGLSVDPGFFEWIIPTAIGAALVSFLEFYYQQEKGK